MGGFALNSKTARVIALFSLPSEAGAETHNQQKEHQEY
jgi:hypothetical protein